MALWRRLGSAGFESSIYRRKRWYSVLPGGGVPSAGRVTRLGGSRVMEEPFSGGGPMFCYTHFRSFVASEQAKPKPKVEGKGGDWRKPKVEEDGVIRLNEAIKEVEVRLVTEQGHRVVPIQEALYLARKLDVDLVEVQRKVKEGGVRSSFFKPAVCKLMDYYKEKYKQDLKGKERAKSKAAIALRNGENKEVRFKAKTELKDLKIKAESVKRLMERGYRVKCTAMPTGKDDENLGGLLLSLLSLIEDIAAVESGPHLDTKNAYVIVKHVKFASKKGKKLSKVMETVSSVLNARTNAAADDSSASKEEVDLQTEEEWETVESDSEIESEGLSKEVKTNTQHLSGSDPTSPKKVVSHTVAATEWSGSNATYDSKPGISFNNTKHTSSKFDVVTSASASHASEESINKAGGRNPSLPEPSVTESNRYSKGGNTNQIRRSNRDGLFPGKVATGNQRRMPEQTSRNEGEGRAQLNPKDRPAHTYNPDSSFSRYGVFGASRSSGSNDISKAGAATMGSPNTPNVPQQRYGVFTSTKSSPSVDQRHLGDIRRDRENKTNSPTSSYGVFNTPKTISSEDQMKLRDASRDSSSKLSPGHANTCSNGNSPSPRFGIFTASKKESYVDSSVSEKN